MRKILSETKERRWEVVKEWKTKAGLEAQIDQCIWLHPLVTLHNHYTGYVKKPDNDATDYYNGNDIRVHGGITFQGSLQDKEGIWVGFDMAHYGDENIPDQEQYAENECESLAEQIVNKKSHD